MTGISTCARVLFLALGAALFIDCNGSSTESSSDGACVKTCENVNAKCNAQVSNCSLQCSYERDFYDPSCHDELAAAYECSAPLEPTCNPSGGWSFPECQAENAAFFSCTSTNDAGAGD